MNREDALDVQALCAHLQARTGEPVTLIETHISWVLLAGEQAYKLKKPVHLPFADARTVAARAHLCREELRLNQRLAASLYLGVLPVRGTASAPRLDGEGATIDHVVCMRRFPPGALAGELLRAGQLQAPDLATLAQQLARFHAQAAAAAPGSPHGSPEQVRAAVTDVLDQLETFHGAMAVAGLRAWLAAQAAALQPCWTQRQRDGLVRECHGDLHLDNLVRIDGALMAFDCLEFDAGLRCIDTASDIAFTTMDLHVHGRPDLAHGLLDDYLQASGDYGCLSVLRFYEVYRALVRALVDGLRRGGAAAPAPGTPYLAWARQAAARPCAAPMLVLMHGLSGSGKSTVARQLVAHAGAVRLRSDVERKRLFGLAAHASSTRAGLDLYGAEVTERTYLCLRDLASQVLAQGYSVIVDAAFLERAQRAPFQAIADAMGLPLVIAHCGAPESVLRARLQARAATGADPSEADAGVLAAQMDRQEGLDRGETARTVSVTADAPLDAAALWACIQQVATAASGQAV